MGNTMKRCCPTGAKRVRVYWDKGLLVQFSGPVPAAKLIRKYPKHLVVYSFVKPASQSYFGKESVSPDRVLIRVVQQGDVLQAGQLYFLVRIPDQYTAKLVKRFDPRTPPMSSRLQSIPSPPSRGSSPEPRDPFQQHSTAIQLYRGEEKPSARDTMGGSTFNPSSEQTPSRLARSNGGRVQHLTIRSIIDHPGSQENPTRLTRSNGRRVTLPRDMTTSRISSQHEKGSSLHLWKKSPRRHSKPALGKSGRPRRSGMRASHHHHKAAMSRPGARPVGPLAIVEANHTGECFPLLHTLSTKRTPSRDSGPAPSGKSPATHRTRGHMSCSGHWTPALNDISEDSFSVSTDSEEWIKNSYNQMKLMTAANYGRRR